MLYFHQVREAMIAGAIIEFYHINGSENPANKPEQALGLQAYLEVTPTSALLEGRYQEYRCTRPLQGTT